MRKEKSRSPPKLSNGRLPLILASFVDCFDTCKQYDFRYKHDFKDYK